MTKNNNWSREETIIAFELYCRTPFGRMHKGNPEIIELAKTITRTPSAVALKLCNFAHLDPTLSQKGASHGSKQDQKIWDEFASNLESLIEAAHAIKKRLKMPVESETDEPIDQIRETDKFATVKTRVGQRFFRAMILSSYDTKCCVTGIGLSEILVASHIIPWSVDKDHRLNPRNGLCLNVMHDKVFDLGMMSLDDDYRVIFSSEIKDVAAKNGLDFLLRTEGHRITLPKRFLPDMSLIQQHRIQNGFE